MPCALWFLAVRRSDLSLMPCGRQAGQKAREIILFAKRRMWLIAIGEQRNVLLRATDLIEQLQRVKCFGNAAQASFDLVRDRARGQQPSTRRLGVAIAL